MRLSSYLGNSLRETPPTGANCRQQAPVLWSGAAKIELNESLIMSELKSDFLFTLSASVIRLHDVGPAPSGTRHVDLLGPGTFEGPRLSGEVLTGGLDMKTIRADDAVIPNVRLVLKTNDDALIFMRYTGIRCGPKDVMDRIAAGEIVDSSEYYHRNTPYFESTHGSTESLRSGSVGEKRTAQDTKSSRFSRREGKA